MDWNHRAFICEEFPWGRPRTNFKLNLRLKLLKGDVSNSRFWNFQIFLL